MRASVVLTFTALLLALAQLLQAQASGPGAPLTLITRDGRRGIPTTIIGGQEFVALDDVASVFQVTVREDALAGGVTISYKGRSVIASFDQPMASVAGRLVTLPAPITRLDRRLMVPLDFVPRALAPIYDLPIDLRRAPRLLILGNVRVPRVVARIDAAGPPTRATLEFRPAVAVMVVQEQNRVVLRAESEALDLAPPPAATGLIDQIRVGDQGTTITLALVARAGTSRISTAQTADGTRVMIEVPLAQPIQDTATAGTTAAPPSPTATPEANPSATRPGMGASARPRLQTMVIDPGHGGDDVGVRGPRGVLEKQVTLDIARRLKTLVETRLGVRVVMTRDDDRGVTLDARDAIANNSKADLFLSIHANSALSPQATGAEVYYLRLDREGESARSTAVATELILPAVGGGTRPIDIIRWDLAQAFHVDGSAAFASLLEAALRPLVPMGRRPLRQEPMRVLTGANMPAALVEIGYLTNPGQERALQSAEFQTAAAQAMFNAVAQFSTADGEADR